MNTPKRGQSSANGFNTLLFAVVAFLGGCATAPKGLPITDQACDHILPNATNSIHIEYLGSGGHIIRYGTNAVLTAPFYSNFSLLRSGFGPLRPKREIIRRSLPDLSAVDVVLVGHSHY